MDPWAVLGVQPTASKAEIKAAFRSKALKLHPDLHASAPEHVKRRMLVDFQELQAAYQSVAEGEMRARGLGASPRTGSERSRTSAYYTAQERYARQYYQHAAKPRQGLGFIAALRARASRTSRADMLLHLALGGVLAGGAVLVEPVLAALWEARNEGRLFREAPAADRVQALRAEIAALRSQRGPVGAAAAGGATEPAGAYEQQQPAVAAVAPQEAASGTAEPPAAVPVGAAGSRQPRPVAPLRPANEEAPAVPSVRSRPVGADATRPGTLGALAQAPG